MHKVSVQRRTSMPHELEDPEDLTFGEEVFEEDEEPQPGKIQRAATVPETIINLPKELRNMLAGGIAGMVAKSFVAPLDRIKILYQVTSAPFKLSHVPSVAAKIIRNEGLSALWKGNTATMIRVFPYSGIQFMVFDRLKAFYLAQHKDSSKFGLTPQESLKAGMMAGAVSVLATYPLDLARAQLAVLRKHKNARNRGFVQIISDNYRSRGLPGLFRGITVTLAGILPYSGIAFALNEQGKRKIQNMTGRDVTTIERMQCGAVAGLVAQSITYPIEVTRRRMQTIGMVGGDTAFGNLGVANRPSTHPTKPPSVMQTVRSLYLEQGVRGFFKGVSVNWMKGPIAFSISFTTFDTVQSLMESDAERARRQASFRSPYH